MTTTTMNSPTTGPGRCRVGMDLVMIDEVAESVARLGHRYLDRVYTPHELGCCVGDPSVVAAGLAARFAAKEATLKVLQPVDGQPEWRCIEVVRTDSGACEIALHGEAARLAAVAGIVSLSLSLSHEGSVAGAVVVAMSDQPLSPMATKGPPARRPKHGKVATESVDPGNFAVRSSRPRLHLVPALVEGPGRLVAAVSTQSRGRWNAGGRKPRSE